MEVDSQEIKLALQQNGVEYVKVAITDLDGVLRGKYMHVDKFLKSIESGYGFCDVIFGWDSSDALYEFKVSDEQNLFTGWHTGFPDQTVKILLDSKRTIPFEKNTPFFLSELKDGEVCPRSVLKKVLKLLRESGLKGKSALEYEFFLFNESPISVRDKKFKNLSNFTPGMFGYSLLRSSVHSDLYQEILKMSSVMDFPLESLHTETGPGVLEAAIGVDEALNSADKAVLFKTFMKVLAQRKNLMATFMAKWSEKYPGQSGHIHCSLVDLENKPVFWNEGGGGMSELMINFLGGLQKYSREFMAMIAPTTNSYKRLCVGAWAPINMTWAKENRTTGFRVIEGSPDSQRIENRLAGADANPYLALAATFAAGFLGIKERLQPTEPTSGEAYTMKTEEAYKVPNTLLEAAELFKKSQAARSIWGDQFVDHFSASRIWEYEQFLKNKPLFEKEQTISSWELERYFEII
ncbi:MAG: glutamine synthetase [Gammaproteobacteria bacterium]|nr:MAG: glutamine synthetase [Gammaproteobacteria bacterium]